MRRFASASAEDLRALVTQNLNDAALLQQVSDELSHRTTRAARALKTIVDRQLHVLSVAPRPAADRTDPAPANPPVKPARQSAASLPTTSPPSSASPPILCIDFGTSSIRAAWRPVASEPPIPLALGEATKSQIDAASIPSAIFVSTPREPICFGQLALERGLSRAPRVLFETSPKQWLTTDDLDELIAPAVEGLALTKRDLIAGLLAHAVSAFCRATAINASALTGVDIRVSHPVWKPSRKRDSASHLAWALRAAVKTAGQTDAEVSPASLKRALPSAQAIFSEPDVDVVEPIAAAVELFANPTNARQACAVIDVGAGTIDLALLISLTPDESAARKRRKLIPLTEPRSIYMAGDFIDDEVRALITEKARARPTSVELEDLIRRRRMLKETLFRNSSLSYGSAHVTLTELEKRPRIVEMSEILRNRFIELVQAAEPRLSAFVNTQHHAVDRIHVVFAGGGADIGFLRHALPRHVPFGEMRSLPVSIEKANNRHGRTRLPASLARLAVAMGGTATAAEWPVHELADFVRHYGLTGMARDRESL